MPKLTKKEMREKLEDLPKLLDQVINSTSNVKIRITLSAIKSQIEEILEGS